MPGPFEREEVRSVLVPFGQAARVQPDSNGLELLTVSLTRAGFSREHPPEGLGAAQSAVQVQTLPVIS